RARDDPGDRALRVPPTLHRQRPDPGVGQGMTATAGVDAATLLAEPHHDGSELYVVEAPAEPGEEAVVRLRVPREAAAEQVFLRYGRDGQQLTVEAVRDEDSADETWWLARFRAWNPTTRY